MYITLVASIGSRHCYAHKLPKKPALLLEASNMAFFSEMPHLVLHEENASFLIAWLRFFF